MIQEFKSVEKRAKSPDFFVMWADELRTIRPIQTEEVKGKLRIKEEPLSVFEITYKEVKSKIHRSLVTAQRGGLNCTSISIDEELAEEVIKHLHHIGYFVVSGPIVDGTIKILINW